MTTRHISRRALGSLLFSSAMVAATGAYATQSDTVLADIMRAVLLERFGGPDVLKVTRIPIPEPKAGEVQVRVAYAGLSPTDILIRAGEFPFHPPLPFIMGNTFSGRITKVGAGVEKTRIGERVTMGRSGGYADYAVGPADQANVIPDGFDWKLGTVAVSPTVTAWHLLHTVARAQSGDVIAVHAAAGAVGLMVVQIAKEMGCKVIALVGSPEKIAWGKQHADADLWLDYRADEHWPEKVKAFNGRGANFIFDGNQGENALKNLQALAPLGQVVFIGAMSGAAPQVNIPTLIGGSLGVRGFVVGDGMALTKGAELKEIIPKLQSGKWTFPIATPVPLESVADLHQAHADRILLGRGIISVGGEI